MPVILRPTRTTQPQSPVLVNTGSPLARGLVFAAVPIGGQFLDVITGQLTQTTGVMRTRPTIDGGKQAATSIVGGVIASFPEQTGLDKITGAHSVFIEGSLEANGTRGVALMSYEGVNGYGLRVEFDDVSYINNGAVWGVNNGSGNVNSTSNALGTNSEQFTHRVMVTIDGTNGRWYCKGALNNTTAFSTAPVAHANRRTRVLGNSFGGASTSASVLLAWDRALSLAEYQQLYQNPWQVFASAAPLLPAFDTGAGGGATITGSTQTATASIVAGAFQAGSEIAGSIQTATASLIEGVIQTGTFIFGTTQTATASLVPGQLQASATITGATLTATTSVIEGIIINGAAIAGTTQTATASLIPGSMSGNQNATINGDILLANSYLIPGIITNGSAPTSSSWRAKKYLSSRKTFN